MSNCVGIKEDYLKTYPSLLDERFEDSEELVKQAIILQLFGGVRIEHSTGERERGDSHVMLLGGSGTAKSHLLKAATQTDRANGWGSNSPLSTL
ncbi:hypothetical protein [Halocatena pleomorpha]|uniref:MCM C-terminal AAA(+) ATPase domain-containing protein n=1 Tax=Halocatena pleomorpha TaxID=1785090 RepID=A0A3P3RAY5_9EURY|nr:hypothetical protein [Halocatena pleomorpha]RRJ30642.1 hypothetical protein EIK79_09175 [Halocatena pleomorpha]